MFYFYTQHYNFTTGVSEEQYTPLHCMREADFWRVLSKKRCLQLVAGQEFK